MGLRHRLTLVLLACALASGSWACKRKGIPTTLDDAPPDRLAPGEVVEGTEKAFGLPLPRASRVNARFAKTVDIQSSVTPEELANFVRKRVTDGRITQGTSSTKLEFVTPRDDKTKKLTIDIRSMRTGDGFKSAMVVQDDTPPPFDPNLSVDERYKKAGLAPGGGSVLDPTHLE